MVLEPVRPPRPSRTPSARPGGPLDPSVLEQLKDLGGPDDPGFLPGVLRSFLDHLDRARDVWRAPASARDPAVLRAAAHGLKGAAGNVGARELSRRAAALEAATAGGGPPDDARPAVVAATAALDEEAARVRAAVERVLGAGPT